MAIYFSRITNLLHVYRYNLYKTRTTAEGLFPNLLQFFYDTVQSVKIDYAQT